MSKHLRVQMGSKRLRKFVAKTDQSIDEISQEKKKVETYEVVDDRLESSNDFVSKANYGLLLGMSNFTVKGIPRTQANISKIMNQINSLGRICTDAGLTWKMSVAPVKLKLGFNSRIIPVTRIPAYCNNLTPEIRMPNPIVKRGSYEGTLDEYVKIFGLVHQEWKSILESEEAKKWEPHLLSNELNQFKKHGLVCHGIKGGSVYELSPEMEVNKTGLPFKKETVSHYMDYLYLHGLSSKGIDFSQPHTMPRQRSNGLSLAAPSVQIERNTVAAIGSLFIGSLIQDEQVPLKVWEYEWDMPGVPPFAGLHNVRNSARKESEIPLADGRESSVALVASGVVCDSRSIVGGCRIIAASTKQMWAQILAAQNLMSQRGIDKSKMGSEIKDFKKGKSEGVSWFETSIDKSRFDSTCHGRLLTPLIEMFPFSRYQIDLIHYEATRVTLGPARSTSTLGTLYDGGGVRLASGTMGTTASNHAVNDMVFFEFCKEYFKESYFGQYRGLKYLWYAYGDDGYFISDDPNAIEALEKKIASFGLIGSGDDGCIFLMHYFPKEGNPHGLISRRLQNFFQPETFKSEGLINSIVVAAHAESLKNHPGYSHWKRIVEKVISTFPFALHTSVEACEKYAVSDQAKRDIEEYAAKNIEAARQVEDLVSGSIQSMMTAGITSVADDSVLALLGAGTLIPDIQVHRKKMSLVEKHQLLDIYKKWNYETYYGNDVGAETALKRWLGFSKNEKISNHLFKSNSTV